MKGVIWFDNEEVWSSSMLDIIRLGGELEEVVYEIRLAIWVNYGLHEKELGRFFDDEGSIIPWKVCVWRITLYICGMLWEVLGCQVMKWDQGG